MDLAALLARVLLELEESNDPELRTLLHRLKEGTHTEKDASDVADLIEALVARPVKPARGN